MRANSQRGNKFTQAQQQEQQQLQRASQTAAGDTNSGQPSARAVDSATQDGNGIGGGGSRPDRPKSIAFSISAHQPLHVDEGSDESPSIENALNTEPAPIERKDSPLPAAAPSSSPPQLLKQSSSDLDDSVDSRKQSASNDMRATFATLARGSIFVSPSAIEAEPILFHSARVILLSATTLCRS